MEQKIRVRQNPEVNFPSWMCEHAVPYGVVEEGDLRLCENCSALLNAGAAVVDESGRPVRWGKAYGPVGIKNKEFKILTDHFTEWRVSATVDTDIEMLNDPFEYKVVFRGLTEPEARALIEAAKQVSSHED